MLLNKKEASEITSKEVYGLELFYFEKNYTYLPHSKLF